MTKNRGIKRKDNPSGSPLARIPKLEFIKPEPELSTRRDVEHVIKAERPSKRQRRATVRALKIEEAIDTDGEIESDPDFDPMQPNLPIPSPSRHHHHHHHHHHHNGHHTSNGHHNGYAKSPGRRGPKNYDPEREALLAVKPEELNPSAPVGGLYEEPMSPEALKKVALAVKSRGPYVRKSTLTKEGAADRRKMQNRLSARRARQRKRNYQVVLEKKYKELVRINSILRGQVKFFSRMVREHGLQDPFEIDGIPSLTMRGVSAEVDEIRSALAIETRRQAEREFDSSEDSEFEEELRRSKITPDDEMPQMPRLPRPTIKRRTKRTTEKLSCPEPRVQPGSELVEKMRIELEILRKELEQRTIENHFLMAQVTQLSSNPFMDGFDVGRSTFGADLTCVPSPMPDDLSSDSMNGLPKHTVQMTGSPQSSMHRQALIEPLAMPLL